MSPELRNAIDWYETHNSSALYEFDYPSIFVFILCAFVRNKTNQLEFWAEGAFMPENKNVIRPFKELIQEMLSIARSRGHSHP